MLSELNERPRTDDFKHKGMRKELLAALQLKGITDQKVLAAMDAVPRHFFLDSAFEHIAYEDRAFPITAGQTISQPYTVAYQTQLLEIHRFDKVLEVGTGSAYQACVIAQLGARVYTIERQKALHEELSTFFLLNKYPNLKRFYGDGYEGLPTFGPFDKVIVTAAAPYVPPKLIEQLKPGGIAVMPVGAGASQKMLRITKSKEGHVEEQEMGDFNFVPMLEGRNA
jgi:protein-L-isoaspartate(D-aspartate) O-methyltransferase